MIYQSIGPYKFGGGRFCVDCIYLFPELTEMKIFRSCLSYLLILLSLLAGAQDFSNKGKDFWVIYPGHIDRTGSRMALYITSDQNASGIVEINGNTIPFTVTANQVSTVRLTNTTTPANSIAYNAQVEGVGIKTGIHITTDNPVVVYSHILNAARSGSTLVLPTTVLGKKYYVATYKSQGNQSPRFCQFDVVATEDNTTLEIVPTNADANGTHPANQPFTVSLSKGDVYQYQSIEDLTGTHIRSIGTSGSSCQPVAVYSGSTWTAMGCAGANSGDNLYQQLFPFASWGKNYFTAPFKNRAYDIFRILVQDPAEPVFVNGSPLNPSTLVANRFYELNASAPVTITSGKPICVFQYMITQNCDNSTESDPEMVILNPVEQTLNDITVMSARRDLTPPNTNITSHYLNIIFKTNSFSSLRIDGAPPIATPLAIQGTNYSYIQEDVTNSTNANPSHHITSDSGFICIAYGYGNVESYGYNAGTNVIDLYQYVSVQNQYAKVNFAGTCDQSPFTLSMTFPYQPTQIKWIFNGVLPDATIDNPVPDSTWMVNGKQLFRYPLSGIFTIPNAGTYPIRVLAHNPSPDGCTGEQEIHYDLKVYTRPHADFNFVTKGCAPDSVYFTDKANANGRPIVQWAWRYADGQTGDVKDPVHFYNAGTFKVTYSVVTDIGCVSDTAEKPVVINPSPVVKFSLSSPACVSSDILLSDASSVSGGSIVKWNWNLGDGATIQQTAGTPFTHNYSVAGPYTISLNAQTDKGCSASLSHDLVISNNPVAGFTLPDNCVADPFSTFLDTSKIADGTESQFSYQWNFGDANATIANPNTSTQKNPKHKYSVVGPYNVTLKVTSGMGCVSSISRQFTVNGTQPQPLFNLNSNSQCSNVPVALTNHSSIDVGRIVRIEIFWDDINDPTNKSVINYPQDGAVYSHTYPTFFSPASKNYQIRMVSYSGELCFNQSIQQITLKASPEIQFDPIASVCADLGPFPITGVRVLNGLAGSGTFSGNGVSSSGFFNPRAAGAGDQDIAYSFTGANGCKEVRHQTATVFPLPAVNAGPDRTVLEGGNTILLATGSGNGVSYRWSPTTGLNNSAIIQPTAAPVDDTYYTIKATSSDGCTSSDEVLVKVLKTPSVPNVFTPNGDGINDKWEIKYLESYPGCTVQIYNSYGQLVFESIGYKPWDGSFKGKQLPAGTYYYIINPKNGRKPMSGFVDIVR